MRRTSDSEMLAAIDRLLRYFQDGYAHMPVTAVRLTMEIAQADFTEFSEDKLPSVTELAEHVGLPQPTVSRLLRMLGDGDDKYGPPGGLKLIDTWRDPEQHRTKRSTLTEAGKNLFFGSLFALHADETPTSRKRVADGKQTKATARIQSKGTMSPNNQVNPAHSAADPINVYPRGTSETVKGGRSACAAVITRAGKITKKPPATRCLTHGTAASMDLEGIILGLESAPRDGLPPRIVVTASWMLKIANERLAEILDKYAGCRENGTPLANLDKWHRIRAAAQPFGGLKCDGGPVEFVAPEGPDDARFLKIAGASARTARKEAIAEAEWSLNAH